MDDSRRQLLILALVSVLVGGGYLAIDYFVLNPPEKAEADEQGTAQAQAEPSAQGEPSPAEDTEPQPSEQQPTADSVDEEPDYEGRKASERTATLETDLFVAELTNRNAGLVSFTLKGERYRSEEGQQRQLVTTDKEPYLPLHPELGGIPIPEDAFWEMEKVSEEAVRFTWSGKGFTVVRKVELGEGPYQLWSTIRITNEGDGPRPVRVKETSFHYVPREAEGGGFLFARPSPNRAQGVCRWDDEIERKPRDDLEGDEETAWQPKRHRYPPAEQRNAPVGFAGVENVYFAKVLAAHSHRAEACQMWSSGRGGTREEPHGSLFEARLVYPREELAAGQTTTYKTLAYLGPKEPKLLAAAGHELNELVDLGWFAFIGEYLAKLLSWIHGFVGNWGVAIILLTFLVKIILFPLTEKSFRSMARMSRLKPEMERINELYADDKEKKGAAIMELYRKEKINPLGGCLPTLLQMPIWFALYQSLSTNVELYHAEFALWWTDLSSPDPYYVLPLLVGGLMFGQQKLTPTTMDPAQAKIMMYFMPIMITTFMLFLPAGLCLYIVTNSALSIAQQQYIRKRLDKQDEERKAEGEEGGGGSSDEAGEQAGSGDAGEPAPAGAGAKAGNGSGSSSVKKRPKKKAASGSSRRKSRGGKRRQRRGRA